LLPHFCSIFASLRLCVFALNTKKVASPTHSTIRGFFPSIAVLLCCVPLLLATGCKKPPAPAIDPPAEQKSAAPNNAATKSVVANKPPADWTANEILQQLLATYRQASTYQDNGFVRLSFRQNGKPVFEEQPTAIALQRPDKLSIVAYQATVKCDGRELRAKIDDQPSGNVDGQMIVRPAPTGPILPELASDKLLYDILTSRLQRQPVQLELLLETGGLVAAFSGDIACQRLSDAQHHGQACFRIEVSTPGGPLVFWIDQAAFLLRRLDYPAAALVPDLASDPSISELSLLADLRDASIGQPIAAGQFTLDVPPNAKRMKRFAPPPQPLPSDLFGQQPQNFYFTGLAGNRLSQSDLAGKIAVLAWYHDNPACEATLQQVSIARQRLAAASDVAFYAIATDPTSVNPDALTRRLKTWSVDLPIVRDLEAFGDKSFHIAFHPTVVILDKAGKLHLFLAGGSPELADQVLDVVQRLERGDDFAAEVLAGQAREQAEYQRLLARGGPEREELLGLPEAVIRNKSEPKKLQLKQLWTCDELNRPGNIVVTAAANEPSRIFVLEQTRSVAEMSADGKLLARHELQIPEQAVITFARTTTDKAGKRYFVASAPMASQWFLFDGNWKLLLAYPPADQAPLQIVDLAFVDLGDADGTPEIVTASVNEVGVVATTLKGDVVWRNRAFPNAVSLATTRPDEFGSWGLLVAGERGDILPVNRFGNEETPLKAGNWPIGQLVSGRASDANQPNLLAISASTKLEPFAVGLNDRLEARWNYPLPPGVHRKPIDRITWSQLFPKYPGEWWLAGPDGSIHLITADGAFFDSFFYGAPLTGLVATTLNQTPTVLISTDNSLSAFELKLPTPSKTSREF